MRKTVLFLGLLFLVLLNTEAQNTSYEFAQLLHGKQVDRVVNEIHEASPESNKQSILKQLNSKKENVLNKIATVYSAQFSANEIQQLLTFYRSPLAQKWNSVRGDLTSKNLEIVMKWGMYLRENQLQLEN